MFTRGQLALPLDCSLTNGFRCATYPSGPLAPSLTVPRSRVAARDISGRAARDDVFEIYRNMYVYDVSNVNAVVESEDEGAAQWRRETVRINVVYGNETILAYLFLPKNQTRRLPASSMSGATLHSWLPREQRFGLALTS